MPSETIDDHEAASSRNNHLLEFALVEYAQAANAYFKGVDVGYSTLKQYVTANVALMALIAARFAPDSKLDIVPKSFEIPIALVGLAMFAISALTQKRYFSHLENCRRRCSQIENKYDGKLFTEMGVISEGKENGITTDLALAIIYWIFGVSWLCFLVFSISALK